MIDLAHPGVNFDGWYVADMQGKARVLSVNGTLLAVARWDLEPFAEVAGAGLLELTTHSVQRTDSDLEEFGKIRIVEILAGDPAWDEETVTLTSLVRGRRLEDVLNEQMIIDVDVAENGRTYATISRPVLQRLIDGKTLGLAIRPLGAINVAFYALEAGRGPRLLFNTK
jgi:predicted transcriptional regulator